MSARPNEAGRDILLKLGAAEVIADALGERPDVAALLLACCDEDQLADAVDRLLPMAATKPLARAMSAMIARELLCRERLDSRQQDERSRFVANALFDWLDQSARATA